MQDSLRSQGRAYKQSQLYMQIIRETQQSFRELPQVPLLRVQTENKIWC